jgi:hypothetical protein
MPTYPRTRSPLNRLALLGLLLLAPLPIEGQVERRDPDRIRLGVVLGGTGFLGVSAEFERSGWSGELIVSTLSFREVGVYVGGKRYLGEADLRGALGAGLWSLSAWTEDGSGSILLLRAPLALDWRFSGENALGLELAWNRALTVRRLDPGDDTPPTSRIIPLPGAYLRHGWTP